MSQYTPPLWWLEDNMSEYEDTFQGMFDETRATCAKLRQRIADLEAENAALKAERDASNTDIWQALIGELGALPMIKTQSQYIADLGKQRNDAMRTNAANVRVLESIKIELARLRDLLNQAHAERDNARDDAAGLREQLRMKQAVLDVALSDKHVIHLRAERAERAFKIANQKRHHAIGRADDLGMQRNSWRDGFKAMQEERNAREQERDTARADVERLRADLRDARNENAVLRRARVTDPVAINRALPQDEA